MFDFFENIAVYFTVLSLKEHPLAFLDILIVAVLLFFILRLIKGTRAVKITVGIFILLAAFALSNILRLETLNWLLGYLITMIFVAIPIVFQPELRKFLERLGRTKIFSKDIFKNSQKLLTLITEICRAVNTLAKNKTGAIIVIKRETSLNEFIETGKALNADVSSHLLLSIFFPNSPLHDGAVIIDNYKVVAAGATLPVAETEHSYKFGTRHKAGLALSEETDAIVVVVSEERGKISLIVDGQIDEVSTKGLAEKLVKLMKPREKKRKEKAL